MEKNSPLAKTLQDASDDQSIFKRLVNKGRELLGSSDASDTQPFLAGIGADLVEGNKQLAGKQEPMKQFKEALKQQELLRPEREKKIELMFKGGAELGKALVDNPLFNPGTYFVEPFLKERGLSPALAFGIGLGVDILAPGPGELSKLGDVTTVGLKMLAGEVKDKLVSKQFIKDLVNRPGIRASEKNILLGALDEFKVDKVPVAEFTNKVKTELLPLKQYIPEPSYEMGGEVSSRVGRYEYVSLPDELRGSVADYSEHIYESPIKTSAAEVHYGGEGIDNYFAHTRIEDLQNPMTRTERAKITKRMLKGENVGIPLSGENPVGGTRRVIELQSDLFQKGGLERSLRTERQGTLSGTYIGGKKLNKDISIKEAQSKLEPYRNTWHERIIREEVKQAAVDGKTKLQFPTGETAMKIEGLGEGHSWLHETGVNRGQLAKPETLKVGETLISGDMIQDNNVWIITDVLGDGKFRAVPKERINKILEEFPENTVKDVIENEVDQVNSTLLSETFDISGTVDKTNPIYKFYEEDVKKFLTSKYNATFKLDDQGVSWWELDVPKTAAKEPVQAFGATTIKTMLKAGGVAGTVALSPIIQKLWADFEDKRADNRQGTFIGSLENIISVASTTDDLGFAAQRVGELVEDDNEKARLLELIAEKYKEAQGAERAKATKIFD